MSTEVLLEKFGYLAIFVGSFLEGEAILVAAGFFAERGYINIWMVVLVGFLGAYIGHIFWFWLGRRYGVKLLDRFPSMKKHLGTGIRMFERYGAAAIIITQWLYGLRITCAVIIGMSRINIVKFLFYEAISCALWVGIVTALGFYFGRAIESVLGRVAHVEKYGLAIIVVIALSVWLYHRWKDKQSDPSDDEAIDHQA